MNGEAEFDCLKQESEPLDLEMSGTIAFGLITKPHKAPGDRMVEVDGRSA